MQREITILEYRPELSEHVLVGLAGFYGTSISFLNRSFTGMDFTAVLDTLIRKEMVRSFIVILPDTMTSFGGNQYINSTAVGNYEDFICSDLFLWIRERYGMRRVGIFGKSSGGFGAYTLTARHPEKFSGFIDVSGDSAFEYCYMRDMPDAIKAVRSHGLNSFMKRFRSDAYHTREDLNAMSIVACSAFYSPVQETDCGFSLPFHETTGEFDDEIWERWLEFDPARNIVRYAKHLHDQVVILQSGNRDEFSLDIGTFIMSRKLRDEGVDHKYLTYDCGHFGVDHLYLDSIPLLIRGMEG